MFFFPLPKFKHLDLRPFLFLFSCQGVRECRDECGWIKYQQQGVWAATGAQRNTLSVSNTMISNILFFEDYQFHENWFILLIAANVLHQLNAGIPTRTRHGALMSIPATPRWTNLHFSQKILKNKSSGFPLPRQQSQAQSAGSNLVDKFKHLPLAS